MGIVLGNIIQQELKVIYKIIKIRAVPNKYKSESQNIIL